MYPFATSVNPEQTFDMDLQSLSFRIISFSNTSTRIKAINKKNGQRNKSQSANQSLNKGLCYLYYFPSGHGKI